MKRNYTQRLFLALPLILAIALCSSAQSNSLEGSYVCGQQPRGLFREITGATLRLSADYNNNYDLSLLSIKEADRKENRWTLDPLDEVDPAYRFWLDRDPSNWKQEKCGAIVNVVGELISPTGKVFVFKEATYNFSLRRLNFITVERDGIKYEGNINFFAESKFVNGAFERGFAELKASGKSLGTVLMNFR